MHTHTRACTSTVASPDLRLVSNACASILEDNVPDFSCIHIDDPLELARYIICACLIHAWQYVATWHCWPAVQSSYSGVLDFEGLVSSGNIHRIMKWPYIKGQEELDSFCEFIKELNIAKISCTLFYGGKVSFIPISLIGWSKQKKDNSWILSAVIQRVSYLWITKIGIPQMQLPILERHSMVGVRTRRDRGCL